MATWRRADKPNKKTGSTPAPKQTPRSYETYPFGSTTKAVVGKSTTGKGNRGTTGVGSKNPNGRAKM